MTWYKTGTASVTNGSPTVAINDANAQLNIFPDDGFVGPDGRTYAVLSVQNATTITLSQNYDGPTAASQPYVIIPVADHLQLRDMLIGVNTLITEYSDILGKSAIGRFASGDATQPGVRGEDHDGTGLVWNADGTLSIAVNGVAVVTFDNGMAFGGVQSVNDGTGIDVDSTDAANPIINLNSAAIASLALADTSLQSSDIGTVAATDYPSSPSGNFLNDSGNWVPVSGGGGGTVTSVAASGGTTGFGFTGGPITSTGTLTLTIINRSRPTRSG
jgi:hypothetical protein